MVTCHVFGLSVVVVVVVVRWAKRSKGTAVASAVFGALGIESFERCQNTGRAEGIRDFGFAFQIGSRCHQNLFFSQFGESGRKQS